MIPGKEQAPLAGVPDGERELAVEALDAGRPPLLPEVDQHLDVGAGAEAVPARLELGAELPVVEDLAVADEDQRAVFVEDRLVSSLQIDDLETPDAERDIGVRSDIETGRIRAAVHQHPGHRQGDGSLDAPRAP